MRRRKREEEDKSLTNNNYYTNFWFAQSYLCGKTINVTISTFVSLLQMWILWITQATSLEPFPVTETLVAQLLMPSPVSRREREREVEGGGGVHDKTCVFFMLMLM